MHGFERADPALGRQTVQRFDFVGELDATLVPGIVLIGQVTELQGDVGGVQRRRTGQRKGARRRGW